MAIAWTQSKPSSSSRLCSWHLLLLQSLLHSLRLDVGLDTGTQLQGRLFHEDFSCLSTGRDFSLLSAASARSAYCRSWTRMNLTLEFWLLPRALKGLIQRHLTSPWCIPDLVRCRAGCAAGNFLPWQGGTRRLSGAQRSRTAFFVVIWAVTSVNSLKAVLHCGKWLSTER